MPKARFYLTLRAGHVQIRSSHTGEIVFRHSNTARGIATALKKCDRMNNSIEADTVTFNIIDHMKSIGKQKEISADFYPVSQSVEIEWRM